MPDLPERSKHEQAVAAAILLLFDDWRRRARNAWPQPILWSSFQSSLASSQELRSALVAVYLTASGSAAAGFGVASYPDFSSTAAREVADYQQILAAVITQNTESAFASLTTQSSIEDFEGVAEIAFGKNRADKIGVTETTRMTSAGEAAFILWFESSDDREKYSGVWRTAEDERVCSVCRPRDGVSIDQLEHVPPAHTYCRCYVDYLPAS